MNFFAGYEVQGMENIPEKGTPALIIYYHGAMPIDLYYFMTKVFMYKDILIHTVADYFLFKIPGEGNYFFYLINDLWFNYE